MKLSYLFLVGLILFSCGKEETPVPMTSIPEDAIEVLDFENQSTFVDSVSIFASHKDQYHSFTSRLNGIDVDLFSSISLHEAGYYELIIEALSDTDSLNLFFQFVILDSERGEAEWGIQKFTPKAFETQSFSLSELTFIYPQEFPQELRMPVIFNAKADKTLWNDYYSMITLDNKAETIKRGIGSILLPPDWSSAIPVRLQNESINLPTTPVTPNYSTLGGSITDNTTLLEGQYYHIVEDLFIPSGLTFHISRGAIIKVDEGINIYNEVQVVIEGREDQPVIFTCADPDSFWGGFISSPSSSISVDHAIFTLSGFHDGPEYQYGHAKRQALFYMDNANLTLKNSFCFDHIGQIFYLNKQSLLFIDNTLFQRAITSGEVSASEIEIQHSTFTDFPVYSSDYADADNDCIYIDRSNAVIKNSAFMWSKDDGIDSGGSGGGDVRIEDCHFEGIIHEAVALSSANSTIKTHTIVNSTFQNCGQGVELGYSSPNHRVEVSDCHFQENLIGVRYGDNYAWPVAGFMEVSNCTFQSNTYTDIWNFVREVWSPIDENLVY